MVTLCSIRDNKYVGYLNYKNLTTMPNKMYYAIALMLIIIMPVKLIQALWVATIGKLFDKEDGQGYAHRQSNNPAIT